MVHRALLHCSMAIVFSGAPGHTGIPDNFQVVQAAKATCLSPDQSQSLVSSDCKSIFMAYVQSLQQHYWDTLGQKKLHTTPLSLSDCLPPCYPVQWEEVVLIRLRLGHTYAMQLYLLQCEPPPGCPSCQEILQQYFLNSFSWSPKCSTAIFLSRLFFLIQVHPVSNYFLGFTKDMTIL